MGATSLDLESIIGGWVEEEMKVVSAPEDVFLDGKFFLNVHVSAEITIVSCDEISTASLGSSVLDDDRTVNVVRVFDHFGHRTAAVFEPLTLESPAALPVQNVSISKGRDLKISEIIRSQILHQ